METEILTELYIPTELYGNRKLQNLAKKNKVRVVPRGYWDKWGFHINSREVDVQYIEKWKEVYLTYLKQPQKIPRVPLKNQIPEKFQSLCWNFIKGGLCNACDGHGLNDHHRICSRCDGRGDLSGEKFDAKIARFVLRLIKNRETDEQIILKANAIKKEDTWDGTLTTTWLRNEEISVEQAERIREGCRQRHEETDYDLLLQSGYNKEDARANV